MVGDARKVLGGALSVALLAASLRLAWRKFVKAAVADKSEVIKLLEVTGDPKLTTVVNALLCAIEDIALTFRHTSQCKALDTQNSFGDEQLNVDVLSNHIIFKYLKDTGLVSTASSEETPEETPLGGHGFSVAFDPLDGSSIVGCNFTVGTIAGVWSTDKLVGVKSRDLKAAVVALYGPRTTVSLALDGLEYGHELTLVPSNVGLRWEHSRVFKNIEEGSIFAPGNLRGTVDNEGYNNLLNHWLANKYTLRYTGGMVPDVNQILIKGQGIFTNASSPSSPAKLRLLYEVGPMAYLMEKSGGASSDGKQSILDVIITHTEQRTQVALGSKKEVERFNELVGYVPAMLKRP